jgi:uncharacterized membrane protein
MRDFVIGYLATGVIMAVLDAIWLVVVANRFYKSQIGALLRPRPNFAAAVVFYLIYVAGVVAFVVSPALERQSWLYALGYGALLGLFAYATYDLTNLATLRGFTLTVVVVDIVWGIVLTGSVSVLAYLIANQFR